MTNETASERKRRKRRAQRVTTCWYPSCKQPTLRGGECPKHQGARARLEASPGPTMERVEALLDRRIPPSERMVDFFDRWEGGSL